MPLAGFPMESLMTMTLKQFVSEKKLGLILRAFARKPEQVSDQVAMLEGVIDRALRNYVVSNGRRQHIPILVDIMVWADDRFSGQADYGSTASALRKEFCHIQNLRVTEVKHGDLFCGLLNYGVARQIRSGCDYTVIASKEAASYWNQETFDAMVEACCLGARATGVATNELAQSVLEGRLANTFCMWKNIDLVSVGGFDLRAAKPADDRSAFYMRGWDERQGDVYYQLAGVEEIIPLARLVETFGPCIAPIVPRGAGVQRYKVPDPVRDPELWRRHVAKMGTKYERQVALLSQIGKDLSFLKGGVMPTYRRIETAA